MAVARRSFNTNQNNAGAANLTVTQPAGLTNGDLLVATCFINASSAAMSITAGGAAWTQLGTLLTNTTSGTGNETHGLWYKIVTNAASEPASYEFTFGTSRKAAGAVVAYSGVDTTSPITSYVTNNYVQYFNLDYMNAVFGAYMEAPLTPEFLVGFVGTNLSTSFTATGGAMTEVFDITSGGGGAGTTKVALAGFEAATPTTYTYPPTDPTYPSRRIISTSSSSTGLYYATAADGSAGYTAFGLNLRASGSSYVGEPTTFTTSLTANEIVRGALDYRNTTETRYVRWMSGHPNLAPVHMGGGLFVGGGGFIADPINADQARVWSFRSSPDFSGWTDQYGALASVQSTYGGAAVKVLKVNDSGLFFFMHTIARINATQFACPWTAVGQAVVNLSTGAISVKAVHQLQGSGDACSVADEAIYRMSDSQIFWLYTNDGNPQDGAAETRLIYREMNPTTGVTVTGASALVEASGSSKEFDVCDLSSTTKALLAVADNNTDDLIIRTINIGGSPVVITFGADQTLTDALITRSTVARLLPIDNTHAYVVYQTSTAVVYRLLTISGDTVTFGDATELIVTTDSIQDVGSLGNDRYGVVVASTPSYVVSVFERNTTTNELSLFATNNGPSISGNQDVVIRRVDDDHYSLGWLDNSGVTVVDSVGYIPMVEIFELTAGSLWQQNPSDNVGLTDSVEATIQFGYDSGLFNPVGLCYQGARTISSTIHGYTPEVKNTYTTPVQVGSVNNLTMARTPVGRIVLGWNDGAIYYCAVLDDHEDAFRNNVVSPSARRVVYNVPNRAVHNGSIWVEGGQLFCALKTYTTVNGAPNKVEVFVANNAENPTSWTLRGVPWSGVQGGELQEVPQIISVNSAGPAVITESGLWVLPIGGWGSLFGASLDVSSLYTSADRGQTWTVQWRHRSGAFDSLTTGPIANTVSRDPRTGFLYWSHYYGPLNNSGWVFQSQDHGASWTRFGNISAAGIIHHFYTDDNTSKMYAAYAGASTGWYAYEVTTVPPTTNSHFTDTGIRLIPSRQGEQFQFIRLGCDTAIIDKNRVAKFALPFVTEAPRPRPEPGPSSVRLDVIRKVVRM